MCHFKNLHDGHKLIEIKNEDLLIEENISLEYCCDEFNENKNNLEELKTRIENEILDLDKLYEKIDYDTTKAFELKHEQLIILENELKEKLKNEVTKIKESLEKNISTINELLREGERIIKSVKLLEKEDTLMIKKLNYITHSYRNQKEMKLFNKQLMKNIYITLIDNDTKIKYEDYYFNGIDLPKKVQFSDITDTSFKMSWEIIDKKKFEFKVEIRKENENKFKLLYEGLKNNCIANNLDKDSFYEIRICSIYNNMISKWTKIFKAQTGLDSLILNTLEINKKKEFINKILEWSGYREMKLIYRGTRDGMLSDTFHNKCENTDNTISLILNNKGNIFGGFSSIPWTRNRGIQNSEDCFLFTLTNIYNIEPTKFPYLKNDSVTHYRNCGPCFGDDGEDQFKADLCICGENFQLNHSGFSNFPNSYKDILGKGKSIFTGESNNDNIYFELKELEVFKLTY